MDLFYEAMRAERERTGNYGADILEVSEAQCPACGSREWDFLMRDVHGDIIGCEDCITKLYPDELWEERIYEE